MRPDHRLPVFLLLLLFSACGESRPPATPVTLLHASDPHLLDARKPGEERLNQFAFAAMMDSVRTGMVGAPPPRFLVVTGDFGLEIADPLFTRDTIGPARPPDSVRARARMDEVVNIVASEMNGSPFRTLYFVPGNNDVFLEDADYSAWSEVDTFVTRVQARLRNREIRDLTACYHRAKSTPADCTARLDSPYVLVGFPTVSFKNAPLTQYIYSRFIQQTGGVPPATGIESRIHRQDTLHLEMLRRFRQALSEGTAGGWRAIVVTHIPDLEDPYLVQNQDARIKAATGGIRLSPTDSAGAWNATPEVFAEWKELMEWPRVAGLLAGHFHDTAQSKYRRPYTWSDVAGRTERVKRMDRCRIFVAPPLAEKNQDLAVVGARGFAAITLQDDEIRRQLYWYDKRVGARHFVSNAEDDTVGRGCAGVDPGPQVRRQGFTINPFASGKHAATFTLSLLMAPLALVFWAAGMERRSVLMKWLWEQRSRVAEVATRLGGTPARGVFLTGSVGVSDLALVRLAWDNWDLVLFALIWFLILVALLIWAILRRPA